MQEQTTEKTRTFLHMSRSTRQRILEFLAGTLLCGLSRLLPKVFPAYSVSTVLYGGMFIAWGLTVWRRILNEYTRRMLTGLVWYMLFPLVLRECRYTFLEGDLLADRLLWYGYYVPFLTMPLLCYFAADSLDEEKHTHNRLQTVLIVLDSLLCIGFLTNDLHHLAFGDTGRGLIMEYHSYGLLCYIGAAWIVILLGLTLLRIIGRIRRWKNLQYPWMPLGILLFFGCWFLVIHLNGENIPDLLWPHLFDLPELYCLMIIAFWESCIQNGMVPSNTNYEDIIRISGISAVFLNDDNSRYLVSENAVIPAGWNLESAQNKPLRLDKNTILHGQRVEGGGILWTEDLSAVNQYNEALSDTAEQLSEENELLRAENEWKHRHYSLEVQNRLYDDIHRLVSPQLSRIRTEIGILKNDPECPDLKSRLAELSFLGAYVKRRANLTLISGEQTDAGIPLMELALSIRESLEYMKLNSVVTGIYETVGGIPAPSAQILQAYDYFQTVAEHALPSLTAMQIRITGDGRGWKLRMILEGPASLPDADWRAAEVSAAGGRIHVEEEDGTAYAEISFVCAGAEERKEAAV